MNDSYFKMANSPILFVIVSIIILFVMAMAVYFFIRAYREGIRIGMDKESLKKAIISSASFTIVPSIGILLGVIALSGSLGVAIPWLRLSVIGALHYETMAADIAAKSMNLPSLAAEFMTPSALVTITFVMTIGIIWGSIFSVLFLKRYQNRVISKVTKDDGNRWGDILFNAMFIGLVCAFIGSSFADLKQGSFISIIVIVVSAFFMWIFTSLSKNEKMKWMESFSLSFAMLIGMASAIILNYIGVR